jgi:hypothetical protein
MNASIPFASVSVSDETIHLSEDQIDDQLIGDPSAYAAAHLAGCGECAERVADAAAPIAGFRDVTMAWSERRSATMPLPAAPVDGTLWQRRMGWAMAAFALVMGLSLSGAGRKAQRLTASVQSAPAVDSFEQPAAAVTARNVAAPVRVALESGDARSDDRYAGDNRMLKAIDNELDASVETPAALGLEPDGDQGRSQDVQTLLER